MEKSSSFPKITTEEALLRINDDPDFICMKRFDYSLCNLLEKYENGAPTKIIAQALLISEDEVDLIFDGIIKKLKEAFKID